VALQGRGHWERNSYLGSHVRSASAYWSGAERLPVPLGKITVQPPDLDYKKKVRPVLLAEVIPAITAMYKMSDKPRWGEGGKYLAKEKWLGLSAQKIVADICSESNKRLLLGDLTRIATGGFEYPRTTKLVDFLYVTKGE